MATQRTVYEAPLDGDLLVATDIFAAEIVVCESDLTQGRKSVTRTSVRYPDVVTERPRIALRQPRSLQPEQLGPLKVCTPAVQQSVSAWILWEDGVEELVPAQAIAWTRRAVRVKLGVPPHQHEVWVWAGAVERA